MVAFSGYGDPGAGTVVEPKPIARMPILKEVTSSSTVSWCPLESHKDFLAAGTVSGTIDDSFQTSSRLMIFNTSLSDRSSDIQVLGQARVKDADFVRISWGAKGSNDFSMPLGLIAGGMSDGSVLLWNADNILNGTNRTPIAAKRHGSHVSGLAFHPSEQNLIASGSVDSELLIWDLKNVSSPTASPPGSAVNTEKSSIVDIAWNLKVAHILACSSSNGQTSVWDLRQKRAVITFTESTHRHVPATAVAWDPAQARQLVVSYAYPAAEVWDLRYGMAPKQILQGGHSRGSILTVAWSQYDSNVILTTGEDSTTCIWSAQDGQLLDSIQDRGTTFCLKWHPFNAELLAGSTYEGNLTIRSISNTGFHVPEWKGRPCGAIFGFGSRLVTFGNGYTKGSVRCFKVSTEPEFVRIASEFQSDISQTDMRTFCSQRIVKSEGNTDEKTTWEFLRLLFENDSRVRFLSRLGFPPSQPQRPNLTDVSNGGSARTAVERLDDVSDEDFFNQLSPGERLESNPDTDAFNGVFSPVNNALSPARSMKQEEPEDEASELDKEINSLLVVGDIERAANLCVKNKRMADALTIASLGSAELQSHIQQLFMNTHKKHYIRSIASSIASRDIPAYIKRSEVSRWKETLALIITYCPPDQYISTVRILVDRLDTAFMNQAAILCSLCCSDVDGAALQWQKQEHQRSGKSRIDVLQASVEKLYVMSQACGQTTGPSASGLYAEYAGLLSAQGAMSMALSFLQIAGGGTDELAYRIYYSGISSQSMPPPPQPFYIKNVSSGSHAAPGRIAITPGGLRRGPIPSQSSVGDNKPSSVPPQNRMMGSAAAPSMGAPRGHPPSALRPPYKPTTGPGIAPSGPRPNSVPPQESGISSSLPSRHLLNDGSQQDTLTNQFSGLIHGSGAPGPSRTPGPTRGGLMPPSRSPAPSGRPSPGFPPSSGPGPTLGRPLSNLPGPGRRPGPAPGHHGTAPSPSMSPAPAPRISPSVGRFGPPSRPTPVVGPPAQRGGPPPSRLTQPPSLHNSNIRQAPSPMGLVGTPQPGPSGQMPRPMPNRPGPVGMGNRVPSPNTSGVGSRPGMPSAHSGPLGMFPNPNPPASRQSSPGPNRFPLQPNAPSGPPGPYQPSSASGPPVVRSAPVRPGMNAPNPTANHPQTPLRPGINPPFPTQNPAQEPFRPQQPPSSAQGQVGTSIRPAINAPGRGQSQPHPPFRPMSASLTQIQPQPPFRPQPSASSPVPQQYPAMNAAAAPGHLHAQLPFNAGRPGPNPSPNRLPGPLRPGMNAPNQPQSQPNPDMYLQNQPHGSFVSADAVPSHQGPVPSRTTPGRPGFPPNRSYAAPGPGSINSTQQQQQQPPYASSNGPVFHGVAAPMRQPAQNPLHQSSSQPLLHGSDHFSSNDSSAYSQSESSDPFSSDFTSQQRASAPVVPPVPDSADFNSTTSQSTRSRSPSPFTTEKAHLSPNVPPHSPNHGRLSPSLSSINHQRGSPKESDDLVELFQICFSHLRELCQDPADKSIVDNASLRFETEVFNRISSGVFSAGTIKSLTSLAKAVQSHNKSGVQQANIALITDCWAEVKAILPVIKSIVEVCKKVFN